MKKLTGLSILNVGLRHVFPNNSNIFKQREINVSERLSNAFKIILNTLPFLKFLNAIFKDQGRKMKIFLHTKLLESCSILLIVVLNESYYIDYVIYTELLLLKIRKQTIFLVTFQIRYF